MYRLYWEVRSGAILPQVVFAEMTVTYERVPVDMATGEHQTPEYLAVNPTGQVPALEFPDGTVDRRIGRNSASSGRAPPRIRIGAPAWRHNAPGLPSVAVVHGGQCLFIADPDGIESVRQTAVDAVNRQFNVLNDAIYGDPWFLPGGYSALDIYLTMLAGWHPDRPTIFAHNTALEQLCTAVEKRPAYAQVVAQHRV